MGEMTAKQSLLFILDNDDKDISNGDLTDQYTDTKFI